MAAHGARATPVGALAGFAVGWNITNVGAVAGPLARDFGVGLGVVGLLTTSLFLVHSVAQIPGGRRADRHGPRPVAVAALALVAAGNGLALLGGGALGAALARALVGLGTGVGFVAGSDYVRASGGGPVAQGLFGGAAMAGGGLALAIVPPLYGPLGWRAPFATAAAAALAAAILLALAAAPPRLAPRWNAAPVGALLADASLRRLAVVHAASLGLNAVVANWSVTLLARAGGLSLEAAGAVGALTLVGGIAGRPLGGWLVRRRVERGRAVIAASLAAGAGGTAVLAAAGPLPVAVAGAAAVGFGAGLAFAPVFGAAASVRPDAPGAAVGMVNTAGNLTIVAGTPLLGLAFALPGDGRAGFAAAAALWAAALLVLRRGAG